MTIHRSLTPEDDGYFVPMGFLYLILGLVFVGLLACLTMGWVLWNMSVELDDFSSFNEVVIERRRAQEELLRKRARVLTWTYEQACEMAKAKGTVCLAEPDIWADPDNYPTLKRLEAGSGLLRPTMEDK